MYIFGCILHFWLYFTLYYVTFAGCNRGGETIETLAGIAADFGQYFTKADIEWLVAILHLQ